MLTTCTSAPWICIADRYGLKVKYKASSHADFPDSVPLKVEVEPLLAFLTDPVRLDRPRKALGVSGANEVVQTAYQYLGYAAMRPGVPEAALSFKLFSNQNLWVDWLGFVMARANSTQHVCNEINHSEWIIEYLLAVEGGTEGSDKVCFDDGLSLQQTICTVFT